MVYFSFGEWHTVETFKVTTTHCIASIESFQGPMACVFTGDSDPVEYVYCIPLTTGKIRPSDDTNVLHSLSTLDQMPCIHSRHIVSDSKHLTFSPATDGRPLSESVLTLGQETVCHLEIIPCSSVQKTTILSDAFRSILASLPVYKIVRGVTITAVHVQLLAANRGFQVRRFDCPAEQALSHFCARSPLCRRIHSSIRASEYYFLF